jgi:hypothetical protein
MSLKSKVAGIMALFTLGFALNADQTDGNEFNPETAAGRQALLTKLQDNAFDRAKLMQISEEAGSTFKPKIVEPKPAHQKLPQ